MIGDGNRSISYLALLGESADPAVSDGSPRLYFRSTAEGKADWVNSVFKVVTLRLFRGAASGR